MAYMPPPHMRGLTDPAPFPSALLRFAAMSLVSPQKNPSPYRTQDQGSPAATPALATSFTPAYPTPDTGRLDWLHQITLPCFPALHAVYEEMKLDMLK